MLLPVKLWERVGKANEKAYCSRAGTGRNKSSGKSFKRFWLSDKIFKAVSPVNVSDSSCVKRKLPKSRSCNLPKGANNLFGKTGSGFLESDNCSKLNANVKASSATLAMSCLLTLTSFRRRTPTRLQFMYDCGMKESSMLSNCSKPVGNIVILRAKHLSSFHGCDFFCLA